VVAKSRWCGEKEEKSGEEDSRKKRRSEEGERECCKAARAMNRQEAPTAAHFIIPAA
jgi:hypothetical protein